jgi:unsaturated rhamnogalacturonyl hydrolase
MTIAFFILLAVIVVVLSIDFIPQLDVWQSRIKIGRWNDRDTWRKKLSEKSLQWLKKTPVIKLTDNNRLIVIDILRGNYKRNAIQHWQQAALVLGLIRQFEKTGDENVKKSIDQFIDSKIDTSGNWKQTPGEIDGVILAYAIMKANWRDQQKFKPAYDAMWQLIQNLIGDDATVQYRKHMPAHRYVDTIGFICPFLVAYGTVFQNAAAVALGCKQIEAFNENGMYGNRFIPCHAYNVKTGMTSGLFGWGRGLGWYAIGLIDAWKELPENHPQKQMLTQSVIGFAPAAIAFQQPSGAWNWLITNDNTTPDSSATATIAWLLSEASVIPEIAEQCLSAKEKALQYLMKVTKRDGAVDLSQGDTKGIGLYSHQFGILPFAQGFALRTAYNN